MNPLRRPQQAGAGDGAPSSVGGAPMSSGGADADLAWLRRLHQAGAGGGAPTAARAVPDPERLWMMPVNGGSAPTGTQ
jgi:hypothetical protein